MRKFYYLSTLLALFVSSTFAQKTVDFGTDTTFEVATWNIEHFPKNGQTTINSVISLVEIMDIDFFAMQEIESEADFNDVVAGLEGYEGYWTEYYYSGMAFLYKSDVVEIQSIYKILTSYTRELPRSPLVAEITVRGETYVIIGNHYKCCGDGYIDLNDEWDEETRRLDASVLLKDYVDTHFADEKVILLGDFNDEILDAAANNVFQPFLDASTDYAFADLSVAQSSNSNWSYPSWPSHLDHLLVTNEIFEEFENGVADVECLKPEEYFVGGWSGYDSDVSDHRPVALRMAMAADTVGIHAVSNSQFSIYPNPAYDILTISSNYSELTITLFNSIGVQVESLKMSDSSIDISDLDAGFYFIKIESDTYSETKRIIKK
jgi:endonuclease/exonuclease/phosphatase family metal-dependent hydrolase